MFLHPLVFLQTVAQDLYLKHSISLTELQDLIDMNLTDLDDSLTPAPDASGGLKMGSNILRNAYHVNVALSIKRVFFTISLHFVIVSGKLC